MTVELQVGGIRFSGWTQVEVRRSIEAIAASFSLSVTHDEADLTNLVMFEEGSSCSLSLEGEPLVSGFVDEFDGQLQERTSSIRVSGRDRTADLVDCSAVPLRQWLNQPINRIVTDLCAPFGIVPQFAGDLGKPWPQFALEPNDKVIDALRRLTQTRGLLLMASKTGGLQVAQPATTLNPVPLQLGENILSASANHSASERFSFITVVGQQQASPTATGRTTNGATATVSDPSVARYRPLHLQAQGQASQADCLRQAQWERASRNGKALKVTVTLPFWRQAPNGLLWDINQLVSVVAPGPPLFVNEPMIVSEVVYTLDRYQGQMTTLTLIRPAALLPQPEPAPPPSKPVARQSKPGRQAAQARQQQGDPAPALGTYRKDTKTGQLIKVE